MKIFEKNIKGFLLLCIFTISILSYNVYFYKGFVYGVKKPITIKKLTFNSDKDGDGINDLDDILAGARLQIKIGPKYKSRYYMGGYPPKSEGVCTDVIWRAFKNAGYNLKEAVDIDIKKHLWDYREGISKPDPNIDFRRVKNLTVFFKKYARSLTTKVIPNDKKNLEQWQRGDIVIMQNREHIAIISDKRRKDGVPYAIHHIPHGPPKEENKLMKWYKKNRIIGHFRYPKIK